MTADHGIEKKIEQEHALIQQLSNDLQTLGKKIEQCVAHHP